MSRTAISRPRFVKYWLDHFFPSGTLREATLSNLQHVTVSHVVFSAADFEAKQWGYLDEFFSTRCGLLTFTVKLFPFEFIAGLGPPERQMAHFFSRRVREPVVLHTIEVAVRACMTRIVLHNKFRLDLTEGTDGRIAPSAASSMSM